MSAGIDWLLPGHEQRVQSEEALSGAVAELPLGAVVAGAEPAAVQPGDRLSLAVRQHFDLVWRSLRRFGVPERLVDDATQKVFMTFSERLGVIELPHLREDASQKVGDLGHGLLEVLEVAEEGH